MLVKKVQEYGAVSKVYILQISLIYIYVEQTVVVHCGKLGVQRET